MLKDSNIIRKTYVLSIIAAIIAAFTSFFSNEVNALLFFFVIVMDTLVYKKALNSRPLMLLLLFYAVSFFYVFGLGKGHFNEMRNILLSYSTMLMCFWIAPGLVKLKKEELKFIWIVFLLCLVENLVATAIIGEIDPMAMRAIFSNDEGQAESVLAQTYSRLGFLSYQSAHILSLLSALLFAMFFEFKGFWKKIILVAISVLIIYVLYSMTVTTALLTGMACIMAVTIFYLNKGDRKKTVVWIVVMTGLLLLTGSITDLLLSGSQGTNYEISEKLGDVAGTLESGTAQGQVAGRGDEYSKTFDAIWRNPIFGGARGPEDTGQHTLVFDLWAYYGFFSLLLFVGWISEIKRMKYILCRKHWYAYLICLLPITVMCFLKGHVFLPNYILATIVLLRIGFLVINNEASDLRVRSI